MFKMYDRDLCIVSCIFHVYTVVTVHPCAVLIAGLFVFLVGNVPCSQSRWNAYWVTTVTKVESEAENYRMQPPK